MSDNPQQHNAGPGEDQEVSALDRFLQLAEKKADNPVHKRLLQASRGVDPTTALESELQTVILEILHAD